MRVPANTFVRPFSEHPVYWRSAALWAAVLLAGCARYQPQPISPPSALSAYELRTLNDAELKAFLQSNRAATTWPPASWDLRTLTLVAFYYHPDLDVARGNWAEARAAVGTAGQRPNPDVTFTPGYNSTSPVSQITPWIMSLDLAFNIATSGKRGHRIAQAQRLSEAARFEVASTAWDVRSRVRRTLLDVYTAGALATLLEQQLAIQESNIALLERQLAAGAISPFEVTQARMAQDATRLAVHDARGLQALSRVALAAALGVTSHALDAVALSYDSFEQVPPALPASNARQQALLNRPDILGALAAYDASQAALQLEIARQYPDIHLGPGYQLDQGQKKWTLGLGAVLPVFNRNAGPIAEAKARREIAAARFTSVQVTAIEEIDGALAGYRNALAKLATADSMFAYRQQQQRRTEAQFGAGDISRLELGVVQVELTNAELARLDARVGLQRAIGLLEDALQSPADISAWSGTTPLRPPPGKPDQR